MVGKPKQDEDDVVRECMSHLCSCLNRKSKQMEKTKLHLNFIRNFKILFIKGENLLFKNPNLNFTLGDEIDIKKKQTAFINQISGAQSWDAVDLRETEQCRSYLKAMKKSRINNEYRRDTCRRPHKKSSQFGLMDGTVQELNRTQVTESILDNQVTMVSVLS